MRILGIDPGYATIGYGVIDHLHGRFAAVDFGAISTDPNDPFPKRLEDVFDGVHYLIEKHHPEVMAVEELFFYSNITTGIDVAQARGVILLAGRQSGLPVYEYTPMQVKQAVVGYGKAVKHQVMEMTKRLLRLDAVPKPDDAADALAIAIAHAHSAGSQLPHMDVANQKLEKSAPGNRYQQAIQRALEKEQAAKRR